MTRLQRHRLLHRADTSPPSIVLLLSGAVSRLKVRILRSGSFDRAGPDPNLMLVWWSAEPDLNCSLGPGDRVRLHQLLNAVLPYDPGGYSLRVGRCGDREVPQLLRLQAPGLA